MEGGFGFANTAVLAGGQERGGAKKAQHLTPEIVAGATKLADVAAVLGSAAALYAVYPILYLREGYYNLDRYSLVAVIAATAVLIALESAGAYELRRLRQLGWQVRRIATVWSIICATGLLIAFATKTSEHYSRAWIIGWFFAAPSLLVASRIALDQKIRTWHRRGHFARRVAIVGAGDVGSKLIAKLRRLEDETVDIVGVFDDRSSRHDETIAGSQLLCGTVADLARVAREAPLDEIIIALPLSADTRVRAMIRKLRHLPVDLRLALEPLAEQVPVRGTSWIGYMPLINVGDRPLKNWAAVWKFVEDKVLASLLLAVFGLPMLLIAIAIKLDSRGPVFFIQERYGFNNTVIRVLKFRTMRVNQQDHTGSQQTVRNDPRVTRLGRFLRASSLDELPQLINVLRGDMSLIGPRAHAIQMKAAGKLYDEAVDAYFMRHRVKPGLTGWAQVHGLRGETDTLDKAIRRVEYDLWYIDNWSLSLDLSIVLATVRIVLKRQNAY